MRALHLIIVILPKYRYVANPDSQFRTMTEPLRTRSFQRGNPERVC